jgi:peptide/nickel transport system substrate-binding protein
MQRRHFLAASGSLAGLATLGWGALAPRPAHAAGTHLQIGLGGAFTTVDPHFYHAVPNHTVAMHMFERLINRAPDGRLIPGLATEWKPLSDTLWEFKLRPGVKWHDGGTSPPMTWPSRFERLPNVPNSPGGFGGFVRAVSEGGGGGPADLRTCTPRAAPDLLPRFRPMSASSPACVGEGATTADYNSGKAAIGTGPYRFSPTPPGNRVEMARNDAYGGGRSRNGTAGHYRFIPNPAARSAALLSGDVDLIDHPLVSDLPRLREDNRMRCRQRRVSACHLPGFDRAAARSPFVTGMTASRCR